MPALITWWTQDVSALAAGAAPDAVATTGAELLERWTEPHRRYHGTRHLVEMFWALEDLEAAGELTADEGRLGRVAAWMHDAVYDPAAAPGANEAASAGVALDLLPRVGLPPEHVETVVGLVRMTADHTVTHDSRLQRAFHDADLWILSAPEPRYDEYAAQVREEYAAVPEPLFRSARAQILRDLLDGGSVYLTDHAVGEWEGAALANVDRELARLSA